MLMLFRVFALFLVLIMLPFTLVPVTATPKDRPPDRNPGVANFEKAVSDLTSQERWSAGVTNYNAKGKVVSFGRYTYDSGTVRRVFYSSKSNTGFVMISNGVVSCERTTSVQFDDSLASDLKSEWLCVKTGNPELVRFVYSLRPEGVMTVLSRASEGTVNFKFYVNSTKLTIEPSKAKNVNTSKIVFTKKDNIVSVDFYRKNKLSSSSYITPAGDSDFITNIDDMRKKWVS